MKKITLTLFLIVFALNFGQAQKKLSDVIGIQNTSTSQVVSQTDEMLSKKSSQIAKEATLRATSQIDIEDLLIRYSNLGNQTGSVGDFFTAAEINQLKTYFEQQNSRANTGGETPIMGNKSGVFNPGNFQIKAETTVENSPNLPIPDNSPGGITTTINVTENEVMTDVNIHFLGSHTWVGDLIIEITSPSGTTVRIVDRPGYTGSGFGCNNNGPNVTLDDAGATPIETACSGDTNTVMTGTFSPNNPLSAFNGQSSLGTWTLFVSDNAGGDTGNIVTWGITYSYGGGGGGPAIAYGVETQSFGFVSFDPAVPGALTTLGPGSGTSGFEGAGAISHANPDLGYALDNIGNLYHIDVPSGVYTLLGNVGVNDFTGLEFSPVNGNLYGVTSTGFYSVNPGAVSVSFIGNLGTAGGAGLAIALAIDGAGNAYTYDLVDDSFYSINMTTGVATLIGPIGFDANFGQGMGYHADTNQVYMAAFNNSLFRAEWRTVNTATGMTSLVGVLGPGATLQQVAWTSIVGSGGGGGGGECEWVVNVQGSGFGDEVTWELRDSSNTVILSGGPYGLGFNDTQTVLSDNGPMTFYIEAIGTFNDNTPSYTVTANGTVVASGTLAGGTDATHSGLECEGGGGGDCEPGDITTFFGGGNQFAGNMFDVTAIGGDDVLIEGFDVNISPGTALISVYTRPGTYVGFENSSAGWTLMGSETVTSAGANMPTYVDVGGLTIPDGQTYGFYVTITDYDTSVSMFYTNGNNVFSDTYVQIQTGIGKGNPDFTGATFLERSWNGTIHYCAGEGGGGEPGDCETGTFSSRAAFEAAFSGTLNLEDFAGGPGDLVGCDGPFNSGGNSCFPAGEILPGISITTSTPSEPDPTVFLPAGMFGNTIDMVGSNQFASYTIIEFPNNDVSAFGFDLIALLGGGNVQVRIFGTGGLIETLSVNASSQVFFGYISSEIITSVELEDLTLANVELIGMLAFGLCEGGGDPGDCVETNVGAGDTDDGLNCAINGTFGAANDITVPAGYNFVLTEITANILSNGDITLVNVLYYDDNSGLPGAQIGSEMGITSPLTSDNIIGNAFGFDIHEIVFDVTQFTFSGDEDNAMTYWIELEIDNTAGAGGIYWEVTSDNMVGNPTALWQGAWGIWDPNFDGVYTWTGDCELIPVSIEENTITGFTFYPNPAVDIIYLQADATIDSVELYNVLGQKVISQQIGSNTSQVDVSGLSVGTYLMTVTSEGVMSTHKVVKK